MCQILVTGHASGVPHMYRARAQVSELTRWLGNECRALVTLWGPGGSGKTRLAIETASQLFDRFSDGAWWVGFHR